MSGVENVLLVVLDQWRADCLSILGHPAVRTPYLDALAADGVLFRRHYTQASPCGPARASLLTGLYLHNHRSVRNGTPLDARHATLAQEARKAGYAPKLFGYTDTSADPRGRDPADPALATYEGVLPGMDGEVVLVETWEPWARWLAGKGYALPARLSDLFLPDRTAPDAAGWGPTAAPMRMPAEHGISFFLSDAVRSHLAVQGAAPWFLHVAFLRPHPPYIAPAPFHAMVDPATVPAAIRHPDRAAEGAQHPWLAAHLEKLWAGRLPVAERVAMADLNERAWAQLRATYYGMVAEADAALGAIVEDLKRRGDYARTLIVVTADHGEMLGDHWSLGKDGWFEPAFHIPLLIRDPRASADATRGRRVDAFTEAVDIMPTVLDWLGRPVPRACDGESLVPFLRGESPAGWRDAAHWGFDFREVRDPWYERRLGLVPDDCALLVLRDARGKYVHFPSLPPVFYDLERDPGELVNRAGDPDYAGRVADYAARLLSWRMRHDERALTHLHLGEGGVAEAATPRRRPQSQGRE